MNIRIPNSAFLGNIEAFIKGIDLSDDGILNITTNPKWMSIHPLVISMIAALSKDIKLKDGSIVHDEITAKSRPYLIRMGLLNELNPNHGYSIEQHESAGRFIPIRQIKNTDDLSQFIIDIVPLLHTTPEQAYPIKYIISELVRNVLEHAYSPIGAIVCAQYFKKSNRISIGVVDRGRGIYEAIRQSHSPKNDGDAIDLALQPGITGTTSRIGGTEYNAGAGLFFTKSIAKVSRDFFLIYSGTSFFKLLRTKPEYHVQLFADPKFDRGTLKSNLENWQGTAVGIDISLNVNRDFDDLLVMIRDAYHLDVRKKNKEKYKKARFL